MPTLGETNPNGQVDLRQAFLGTASDADGDDWLYFAWERDNNTGSGFIAFEFMQDPPPAGCGDYSGSTATLIANCNPWANRQAGDFIILWDQQGGSKDLFLRTWTGTSPNLVLGAPVPLNASVSAAEYSADGFFGEAALNLTDTVFGGSNACQSFANVIPSTVTGNSDTADYKDTILQPVTRSVTAPRRRSRRRRTARYTHPGWWRLDRHRRRPSRTRPSWTSRVEPRRQPARSRSSCARSTRPPCATPAAPVSAAPT